MEREGTKTCGCCEYFNGVVGGAVGIKHLLPRQCQDNDKEGAVGSDLGSDTLLSGCDTCF